MKLSLTRRQAEAAPGSAVLGPWCLPPGQEADSPRLRPPCPWGSRAAVREAIGRCRVSYERILPPLGAYLNSRLKAGLHECDWRLLLGFWLRRHIQQVEDRQLHLVSAMEWNSGLKVDYLEESRFRPPRDSVEFMDLCVQDDYNWQLFSQLGPLVGLAGDVSDDIPTSRPPVTVPLGPLKRGFNLLANLSRPEALLCDVSLGRRQLVKLMAASRLQCVPIFFERASGPEVAAPFNADRVGLARLDVSDTLDRLVAATLPAHLPTIFLEGYVDIQERSSNQFRFRPRTAASAVGWLANDAWRFAAVRWREAGTRCVGIQHGAGYGMYLSHQPEEHETQVVDAHLTWGNSDHTGAGFLPDPDLSDLKRRRERSEVSSTVLFVSNTDPRIAHSLNAFPVCEQILDYMELQFCFLRALAPSVRSNLVVRLYPKDLGWDQAARLAKSCESVKIDDSRVDLASRLCEASLVICDHPGTAMIEAFAADIPCLLLWERGLWEMRPTADSLFDELAKSGILYGQPELAAEAVRRIAADPQAWWGDPARRQARAHFADRFAKTATDWPRQWRKMLTGR